MLWAVSRYEAKAIYTGKTLSENTYSTEVMSGCRSPSDSAHYWEYPIKNGFTLMSVGVDIWIGCTGQVQLINVTYAWTHSQMMGYASTTYSLIIHIYKVPFWKLV